MNLNALEYISSSDEEDATNVSILRKNMRNSSNPLDLPNCLFRTSFRMKKQTFIGILEILDLNEGQNINFIPPIVQLGLTLNFLGGGAYQHQLGRDFSTLVCQGMASRILSNVLNAMENKLCPMFIKFEIQEQTKTYFQSKFGIPKVIGCVGGTHVTILKPKIDECLFFNSKGKHSINAMIICDENYKILSVNPRYGGCAHNSFVWEQSAERSLLQEIWSDADESVSNCWLLGDSGYPLEKYLMTPYRAATEGSPEAVFNTIHAKACSTVERCIGVLKGRWRVILEERKCRYAPEKVGKIINACVALHNICVRYNDELPEEEQINNNNNNNNKNNNNCDERNDNDQRTAIRIRNNLRDMLNL